MVIGEHGEWWNTNSGVTSRKIQLKNTSSNSVHMCNRPERSEQSEFCGFMVKNGFMVSQYCFCNRLLNFSTL